MRPAGTARPADAGQRPTSTTVRLLHGLGGGVELGVRHTGRKAMVFVRFRKLVVAGWWKAPSVAGKTPFGSAAGSAEGRTQAQPRKPAVLPAARTRVASPPPAAPVPGALRPQDSPRPAESPRAPEPSRPPKTLPMPAAPDPGTDAAAGPNVMHRLWNRFSAAFKNDR